VVVAAVVDAAGVAVVAVVGAVSASLRRAATTARVGAARSARIDRNSVLDSYLRQLKVRRFAGAPFL
jgi:hypothetical protein